MSVSRITKTFRVTIPADVRKVKRLKDGDWVLFAIRGERVELHRVEEDVISRAAGLWRDSKKVGTKYERRVRHAWAKRARRARP